MASERDFGVEVEDVGDGSLVKVVGGVDMATSPDLESALERTRADGEVVIDLTECDFLDSAAIRVILTGIARSESAGGSMSLVAADPRVRRVLEIAGVDGRIPIHTTRNQTG